jgi:UDP-N-acetylmuramate-alanine ligase
MESELKEYWKEEYWDKYYEKRLEPFDWFQDYEDLEKFIKNNIQEDSVILNVGCGNSCKTRR